MEEALSAAKARILCAGEVFVEPGFSLPKSFDRSTAGPGTGRKALAFRFHGVHVKLAIADGRESRLHLTKAGKFVLDGDVVATDVEVEPILLHCPGQAFANLGAGCIHDCAFCSTPNVSEKVASRLTDDRILSMILKASKTPGFQGVAMTCAVEGSSEATARRMVEFVRKVRAELPRTPIGVEPYLEDLSFVAVLKEAGADEIKVNLEAATGTLFAKVCPGRDWESCWKSLERSVEVFGRGKVTSNVIFGLGETDEEILDCVERLAKLGVVANLRMLRVTPHNREKLMRALGKEPLAQTPERALKLAKEHKRILEKYNLTTLGFKTMCFPCGCCDLVPFRDL